jgi:hypothetical protein
MSTVKANAYYDTSGGSNAVLYGVAAPANSMGFRNRIINGDMRIDQRNAGASVTLTAANFVYPVDRMYAFRASGTSGAVAQRVASGITPSGYALRVQRNNGDTATAALGFGQVIETANCGDLAGITVTFSFKARCGANFSAASSQITARIGTGTGTDQSAANFYNAAWTGQSNTNNTPTLTTSWQTFSYTITAGSSVSQIGVQFFATPVGTAGANDWFEITDIQVEAGSVASPFERVDYGRQLMMCQRYLPAWNWSSGNDSIGLGYSISTTQSLIQIPFPVTPRVAPTGISVTGVANMVLRNSGNVGGTPTSLAFNVGGSTHTGTSIVVTTTAGSPTIAAGQGAWMFASGASQILFTGSEL